MSANRPDEGPATPLPWRVDDDGQSVLPTTGPLALAEAWLDEDAAYIVEACNAYPALLKERDSLREALRGVMPMAEEWFKVKQVQAPGALTDLVGGARLDLARAALAPPTPRTKGEGL